MPYLIHSAEPAADGIRRVLREQNRTALRLLQRWRENPARQIHQTRQTCKKIRGLLRLIRPSAGYIYEVENRFYRDIQRSIAYARDATAMVEVLAVIESRPADPAHRESVRMVRNALEARATATGCGPIEALAVRIEAALHDVGGADQRLQRLPVDQLRRRDLRKGVRKTVGRCSRAFAVARVHDAEPEPFHAWRKHVKYAYYQSRLMREILPDWANAAGPRLKVLAELLGHIQDLALLDDWLAQQPDELCVDNHLHRLDRLVRLTQRQFRQQALKLGAELFESDAAAATVPPFRPARSDA